MITIKKIKVEDFESKVNKTSYTGTRLSCEIEIDGKKDILFIECEQKWKKYLLTERADAFVFFLLPIAMREKHDIASYLPITQDLKTNLEKEYIPALTTGDKTLYIPKIFADTESEPIGGNAVGTANSLGVDSFYTVYKYANSDDESLKITHFYMGAVSLDLWGTHSKDLFQYLEKKKHNYDRYKLVSDELGKELIMTYSNFYKFMCKKHKNIHISVHSYITLAEIMCFKKLWRTYLFSSAFAPDDFSITNVRKTDCSHYDRLTVAAITVPDLLVISSGADCSRHEKTKILADYPPAQKYLRPCFNFLQLRKDMKNCGRVLCPKCLRLLVSADVAGNLEKFKDVVDIEKYKRRRKQYFRIVVWGKGKSPFLKELYFLCREKYPKIIKGLERFKNFITFKWKGCKK
ncbi:MAG: hypothetical protein E7375_03090 [Clostridiales bacterium]|nr:hypothetical protein [Clostridiales bacterium]